MIQRFFSQLKAISEKCDASLMLLCSCGLWLFCFRGFVFGPTLLRGDAAFYYDHAKFFVDHFTRGIIPLWDPTWFGGFPNEFFMRRMGEFNPFFGITFILFKCGVSFGFAYISFLVVYFFVGMGGFYVLARRVLQDRFSAVIAFHLLIFSSLSVKIFDSYLFFLFVPIIWFFVFLLDFFDTPRRGPFLGVIFSLMLIVTTYVPFYFLTIFLLFVTGMFCCYFSSVKKSMITFVSFIRVHKVFTLLCLSVFVLSCLPALMFFKEAAGGAMVMPVRQSGSTLANAVGVDLSAISLGGIILPEMIQGCFSGLDIFQYDRVYIPLMVFVFIFCAFVTLINKKTVLMLWMAMGLLLIGLTNATPVAAFLYQYGFYFKYFRNYMHFLWIAILPLMILIIAEHVKLFMASRLTVVWKAGCQWVVCMACHVFLFYVLKRFDFVIVTSFITLVVSAVGFSLLIFLRKSIFLKCFYWFFFCLILVQPLEVYSHLGDEIVLNNHGKVVGFPRSYDNDYMHSHYFQDEDNIVKPKGAFHISSKQYKYFHDHIDDLLLKSFLKHRFVIVDQIEMVNDQDFDTRRMNLVIKKNMNLAFVSTIDQTPLVALRKNNFAQGAQKIQGASKDFEVLDYDVNQIKIRTHYLQDKFLIVNDSYHQKWQVKVNNQESKVYRANFAFKGIDIPAGKNLIELRYATRADVVFKWALFFIFYAVFGVVCYYYVDESLSRFRLSQRWKHE